VRLRTVQFKFPVTVPSAVFKGKLETRTVASSVGGAVNPSNACAYSKIAFLKKGVGESMKAFGAVVFAMAIAGCSGAMTPPPAAVAVSGPLMSGTKVQLQTLDVPIGQFPAATATLLTGIRGNLITGFYVGSGGANVAVTYDQNSAVWTAFQFPAATSTSAYGPDLTTFGFRIVGSYVNFGSKHSHGFLYDSVSNHYMNLDVPPSFCSGGCNETIAHSIYGDVAYNVVGNYDAVKSGNLDGSGYPASGHAFLYDSVSASFKTIDISGAISTTAYGIWTDGTATAVAGGYTDKRGTHAYVRSLTSNKKLVYDDPHAAITHFEGITGAGGAGNYNLCGDFVNANSKRVHGFFLPVRNWKAGTPVIVGSLSANSVYARTVIGVYKGAGQTNGYIAQIP
jgi:subtilase-type serine protease